MKILFVATEAYPFIRTGGLGDVMGALPVKLAELSNDVRVIIPKYSSIKEKFKKEMKHLKDFTVNVSWRRQFCGIEEIKYKNVTFYFIDNEYYFKRECNIYGHYDDGERFAFFDRAVLEMLKEIDWKPDVINCNDWHCGMIPALFKLEYIKDDFYKDMKFVFTIHNLLFQGIYDKNILPELFGYDLEQYNNGQLKFDENSVSFMKAALVYADKVTTVSETYAEEIKTPEYGERLEAMLRCREQDLRGIVNGIDYEEYNPSTDKFIASNYSLENTENKVINKLKLQEELGLEVNKDIPLMAIITRLTDQKGIDLIINKIPEIIREEVQLVVLGTGEKNYEDYFRDISSRYNKKIAARITFDTALSHRIYAGADMFLMPSRFEPCGLGQLIALRYGAVPIVRETGGLKDTIEAYDENRNIGNGFSFKNYSSDEMMKIIKYAVKTYSNKKSWNRIFRNAMSSDNSWDISAIEYLNVYNILMGL
ncbi:MAG: glycogen synthase GlgA [Sarcina sp.]